MKGFEIFQMNFIEFVYSSKKFKLACKKKCHANGFSNFLFCHFFLSKYKFLFMQFVIQKVLNEGVEFIKCTVYFYFSNMYMMYV